MKRASLLFGSLAVIFLLIGCGDRKEKRTKLVFAGWGNPSEMKLNETLVAEFNEKNPNTDVEFEHHSSNLSVAIQADFATGSAADVFYLDIAEAAMYMEKGIILPIDNYVSEEEKANYLSAALNSFAKDGRTYGLPKDFNTLVLFYNKRMFSQLNLEPPKTYSELIEVSHTINQEKSALGSSFQTPLALINDGIRVIPFVEQLGGSFVDSQFELFQSATPEIVKGYEAYVNLFRLGLARTPEELGTDWLGSAFGEERVAMVMSGGWSIPFLRDYFGDVDYGIVTLPIIEGGTLKSPLLTVAIAINKNTKHPEEAVKLALYLSGREAQIIIGTTQHALPTYIPVYNEIKPTIPEALQVMTEWPGGLVPWNWGVNTALINLLTKDLTQELALTPSLSVEEGWSRMYNKYLEQKL